MKANYVLPALFFLMISEICIGQVSQWQWAKTDGFHANNTYRTVGNGIAYSSNDLTVVEVGTFNGTSVNFNCLNLTSNTSPTRSDIFLVKKDKTTGGCVFAKSMGGAKDDIGNAVAVEPGGRIYFVGKTYKGANFGGLIFNGPSPNASNGDWFISGYSSVGAAQFVKGYGSPTLEDEAKAIAVENGTGYGYVTGYQRTNMAFIRKVQLSGSTIGEWESTLVPSVAGSEAVGTGVTVDGDGSVVATGYFKGSVDLKDGSGVYITTLTSVGGYDFYVVKYRPSGFVSWYARNGGTGDDQSTGIVSNDIPLYGGVYITGNFTSPTITFNNSNMGVNCQFNSIVKTNNGATDIFVCAYSTGISNSDQGCLACANTYGVDGVEKSNSISYRKNSSGLGPCITGSLRSSNLTAFDPGCSNSQIQGTNIYVLKLDQKCALVDSWWYNWVRNSNNAENTSNGICTDGDGYFYITGAYADILKFNSSLNVITSSATSVNAFCAKIQSLAHCGPDVAVGAPSIGTPAISTFAYSWCLALCITNGIYCVGPCNYCSTSAVFAPPVTFNGVGSLGVQGNCLTDGYCNMGGYDVDNVQVGPVCRVGHFPNNFLGEISVQPNPNRGVFDVKLGNDDSDVISLSVVDLLGRVVYKPVSTNGLSSKIEIALPDDLSGQYILNISTTNQKYHSRIIIQK